MRALQEFLINGTVLPLYIKDKITKNFEDMENFEDMTEAEVDFIYEKARDLMKVMKEIRELS